MNNYVRDALAVVKEGAALAAVEGKILAKRAAPYLRTAGTNALGIADRVFGYPMDALERVAERHLGIRNAAEGAFALGLLVALPATLGAIDILTRPPGQEQPRAATAPSQETPYHLGSSQR